MDVPIQVRELNGEFVATILGSDAIRVASKTRSEAIAELRRQLNGRAATGELTTVSLTDHGRPASAGIFADDPTWPELVAEIYRERDAQPKE